MIHDTWVGLVLGFHILRLAIIVHSLCWQDYESLIGISVRLC